MSDNSPTLHNHILHALEEHIQLREQSPDKKRAGVLAAGLLLTQKKRKLTEVALPVHENKQGCPTVEQGQNNDEAKPPVNRDLEYYQRMKDECLQQEAEQSQWAKDLQTKVHDLRDVYIYGLTKV